MALPFGEEVFVQLGHPPGNYSEDYLRVRQMAGISNFFGRASVSVLDVGGTQVVATTSVFSENGVVVGVEPYTEALRKVGTTEEFERYLLDALEHAFSHCEEWQLEIPSIFSSSTRKQNRLRGHASI